MSPEEIDRAIDALSDQEIYDLYDAAGRRWSFRVQNWALPIAIFGIMVALILALRVFIRSYWPGSFVAGMLGAIIWCGVLMGLLRSILSMRFAVWRTQRAARREYRVRHGAA
jgi:hypothetical protein